ncbi:hypothetical protein [Burkholderia ubonensis]|uniref:hypothetical protein n=1 Tax=Burkholderia ubonensis TaxID=101571 RepID=UPI00075C3FD2|nr:hypothetical protein [Burkholderia ubonensis]KVL70345.1 hypothetical protein WJ49_22810 [Burkholderia ubonensis]KVL73208.1 hypothetical protein WJ48_00505 [Burkholderia ubonensis]KVL91036.1 hypothetical protein WJ50_12940 [Burkholderia ubonensis]
MNRIFGWIRTSIRGLLFFLFATAALSVVYWLIERGSIDDLIGVSIVALGWFVIAYVMWKRGWPRDVEEW